MAGSDNIYLYRFGHLNDDGSLDLLTSDFAAAEAVNLDIYLNTGEAYPYSELPVFEEPGVLSFNFFDVADLNGDNVDEMLLRGAYMSREGDDFEYTFTPYSSTTELLLVLNQGDISGDNFTDCILYKDEVLYVGVNDQSGDFSDLRELNGSYPISNSDLRPIIGDFTGDGLIDVISYGSSYFNGFKLYEQQSDGSFSSTTLAFNESDLNGGLPPNLASSMETVDYQGDGLPELVFENDFGVFALKNEIGSLLQDITRAIVPFSYTKI